MELVLILGIFIIVAALLYLYTRRLQQANTTALRPLVSMKALSGQIGQAIESGSRLHLTVGQGSLTSQSNPISAAALSVLDHLAKDGCASGIPPITTVGDGTLLLAAEDSLRHAYDVVNRKPDKKMEGVQFVAAENEPFAYAGGTAVNIHQHKIISNVMVGRFGPEMIIMAEAANRKGVEQVIGSVDPTTLAVATAVTPNILIGEELLAASAYLDGSSSQRASLQVQDILRWVTAGGILLALLIKLIAG
jgi:hypothetical protein